MIFTAARSAAFGVGVLETEPARCDAAAAADSEAGVGDLSRQFFNHNSGVIKFSTMINEIKLIIDSFHC